MKCVFSEFKSYKKELLFIILTTIGTTLATLGLPSILTILIDKAYPAGDINMVLKYGGIMIALVVFGLWCGIMTSRLSATVSMGIGRNLQRCNTSHRLRLTNLLHLLLSQEQTTISLRFRLSLTSV